MYVSLTNCGSSSRTFGTTDVSVARLAGGVRFVAPYAVVLVAARPNAARVASMLRSMNGASFSLALGFTSNVCTAHG